MNRFSSLGLHRKELRAWAMYDWANSAFITSVITVFYPVYFAQTAAKGLEPATVTGRYAMATTIALAAIALISPFLGLLADRYAIRKRMLAIFLTLGVGCTAGLALVGPGDWMAGLVLFGLANMGASGSFVFYDSLLPHVAKPEEIDKVSSAGYAAGYFGGGTLLAINVAWVLQPEFFGMGTAENAMRWSFASVALWWACFSIPLFRHVAEPPANSSEDTGVGVFAGLLQTMKELRRYDQAFLMLLAFLIYNDGIGTIIRMTSVYGTEIGIGMSTLISAILVVQFLGIPCTFAFAALASRIGAKMTIAITIVIYMVITVLAYRMTTSAEFWTVALLVACAQGGCQALSRSLFASMIPEVRSSEFFAFFAVAEKFAGVLGTGLFAVLVTYTGSGRTAVLSLVVFFLVGGFLLSRVSVEKGRRQALGQRDSLMPSED